MEGRGSRAVHVLGNFIARVQTKRSVHEGMVGQHTFDRDDITCEKQGDSIIQDRHNLLGYAR